MTSTQNYRADIDGMRAVAVLLVVIFHANAAWLSGGFIGVDVFFVISGYLIGTILMDEITRTGRINLIEFWARRTRRLAPSAVLVVLATLAAAWFILPPAEILRATRDAVFGLFYVTNWQNLIDSVDYFGDRSAPSLFVHFWSLAVEEQFYIYFCILFVLAKVRSSSADQTFRRVAALSMVIASLSFIACVVMTRQAQPVGYFGTHTRIWQLSMGLAIALLARAGRLPSARAAQGASGMGLFAILFAAVMFEGEAGYPGVLALLPTLGAAALIWAGMSGQMSMVSNVLSFRVLTTIGKRSYALYLWHWPVFQLWKIQFGQWTAVDMALAIFLTAVLAGLSYHFIENPVRHSIYLRSRPKISLTSLVAAISFAAIFAGALQYQIGQRKFLALPSGQVIDLNLARRDIAAIYAAKCHVDQPSIDLTGCVYGSVNATKTIVLLGDSHSAQWFSAVDQFGRDNGYAVHIMTKSACIPVDAIIYNSSMKRVYSECAAWREKAYQKIQELQPDAVLIGASSYNPYDETSGAAIKDAAALMELQKAQDRSVARLAGVSGKVVLFQDTPRLNMNAIDCLESNPKKYAQTCAWPIETVMLTSPFPWSQKGMGRDWFVLDMLDQVCPNGICAMIQGDLVTMRDTHHLTDRFAAALAPEFARRLNAILAQ
jgi:peptidoglycan/LPS O-acetylase OafA/YrhL